MIYFKYYMKKETSITTERTNTTVYKIKKFIGLQNDSQEYKRSNFHRC
jgi:hypothetical protein